MKKLIVALSLIAAIASVSFAGDDKKCEKKCEKKSSCCKKSSNKTSEENKDVKPVEQPK